MKCPKCGSASPPGLEQCDKCGHRFTQVRGEADGIPPLFHQPLNAAKAPATLDPEFEVNRPGTRNHDAPGLDITLGDGDNVAVPIEPQEEEQEDPRPSNDFSDWQSELAERVQEYRQRRARLTKKETDGHKTLDFDFESPASPPKETHPNLIEFPSAKESDPHPNIASEVNPDPRSLRVENFEPTATHRAGQVDSAPGMGAEFLAEAGPLEIEFGSSLENTSDGLAEGEPADVPIARMSMRFLAGVIDTLVLLSGAIVYGLIFWKVGGHFSRHPLDLAVEAVIAIFFILLYFGGCTALASATPGLIWAGLEVSTFEGSPLRLSHCLWRAFGYLVSISALMLGFIWAAVDADGLTWHDRMSRTFIVPTDQQ